VPRPNRLRLLVEQRDRPWADAAAFKPAIRLTFDGEPQSTAFDQSSDFDFAGGCGIAMAYFRELARAANWLQAQANDDGGWGMVPGQSSSMVNTSEALYVLAKAGRKDADCAKALQFIRDNLVDHVRTRGPRLRYVAFPLMTLAECFPDFDRRFQRFMQDWLLKAMNPDHGWGEEANNRSSDLFSTYLAVTALSKTASDHSATIAAAGRWVISQFQETGWALHSAQPYSATAIAYSLNLLATAHLEETPAYKQGRELLLANDNWENEETVMSGTKWLHCKPGAVIHGLVQTETDILLPPVASAVRTFQRCITPGEGWTERQGENTPTIRSQYGAVFGMAPLMAWFDPAIVIPRVDAMRKQGMLQEPQFLPFGTGTRFHTILPAFIFRFLVWCGILFGFAMSLGALSVIPSPPHYVGSLAGLALMSVSLWLIGKRRRQFPRIGRWVQWLLISIGALGAVFGVSPLDLVEWVREAIGFFD
jgi:hypothetical protein